MSKTMSKTCSLVYNPVLCAALTPTLNCFINSGASASIFPDKICSLYICNDSLNTFAGTDNTPPTAPNTNAITYPFIRSALLSSPILYEK